MSRGNPTIFLMETHGIIGAQKQEEAGYGCKDSVVERGQCDAVS